MTRHLLWLAWTPAQAEKRAILSAWMARSVVLRLTAARSSAYMQLSLTHVGRFRGLTGSRTGNPGHRRAAIVGGLNEEDEERRRLGVTLDCAAFSRDVGSASMLCADTSARVLIEVRCAPPV